jgi:hypothetical protein
MARRSITSALLAGLAVGFLVVPAPGGLARPGSPQGRRKMPPTADRGTSAAWRTARQSMFGAPYQQHVVASSHGWRISLLRWGPCRRAISGRCFFFVAGRMADHKIFRFRVANFTSQVDVITVVGGGEAAILGRVSANLFVITLVALPSGRQVDMFVGYWPAISPSLRYIAYVKWFPEHMGYGYTMTSEYLAYDVALPPSENRPRGVRRGDYYRVGWPLYPPGAANSPGDTVLIGQDVPAHVMVSDGFFWLGKNAVAFVDRWRDVNSLVVGDLSVGIRHPRITVRRIETSRVVNFASCAGKVAPSDLERWRKGPGSLIHVQKIRSSPGKPGWVRLILGPQPCLSATTLDLPLVAERHQSGRRDQRPSGIRAGPSTPRSGALLAETIRCSRCGIRRARPRTSWRCSSLRGQRALPLATASYWPCLRVR